MKVVIMAGGFGTRLGEHTRVIPKPMVRIGQYPILWHIMKIYSQFGFNEFVLALGYKKEVVTEYFMNYYKLNCDLTVDLTDGTYLTHKKKPLNWQITIVDTGLETMTGGRLKRLKPYLGDEPFFLTYGDGLADIDIDKELAFHRKRKKIGTMTAVHPPPRFGVLDVKDNKLQNFTEKSIVGGHWVNGGFFIFESEIFSYLGDDSMPLERAPLENLTNDGQLSLFQHPGFWHCIDNIGDLNAVNKMVEQGNAPWIKW